MRHPLIPTLTAAALLLAASPALADSIKLSDPAAVGAVQVTFDEDDPSVRTPYSTVYGVDFGTDQLFADRYYEDSQGGTYNGFAGLFGGGVVGANFYFADGYPNWSDVQVQTSQIDIDFGTTVTRVGFHYLTVPGDAFSVTLLSGGTAFGGFSDFVTEEDDDLMPIVAFAGIGDDAGFDGIRITLNSGQAFAMNDLRLDVNVVPLPPAAYMGFGLLAGIGVLRRLRRRRASTL